MTDTPDAPDEVRGDDVDDALVREISLPLGEADVAIVAELLMGRRSGLAFQVAPPSDVPSQDLRLAVARILATGVLRFLRDSGGRRRRTVLRAAPDGGAPRRVSGRLWDAAVNVVDGAPWTVRFSAMPFSFVWGLCRQVLPLHLRRRATEGGALGVLGRAERAQVNAARPGPAVLVGDHVFCAVAHEHMSALKLPSAFEEPLRRALRASSPFSALFCPDEPACPPINVDALMVPPLLRLLELCDEALAAAWVRRLHFIAWRSADVDEFMARCRALARTLHGLLRALDHTGRLDLCGPIVTLVVAIAEELPADTRARLVRLPGVSTMADREQAIEALAQVCSLGDALDDVYGRLLSERYGDDRFVEAQLVLPLLDETWLPRRNAHQAFVRALSGTVG